MKLKRFVSILLCALLALTPLCLPAGAADGGSGASYTADCPYVKVLGLMSTDIYADKDDPSQGTVWPPQAGVVVKDVLKLVPSLFELAITKNYGKFGPKLYDAVHDIFAPLYFYNEARVTNNSGPIFEYPAPDKIKKDSYVIFEYDWRLAPEELAAQLNDFIDYVLECSGSEQIVLECHSYGGVVGYTYLNNYGTQKVRSVAFNAAAVYGTTFVGELCAGKVSLDPEGLTEYMKCIWAYNGAGGFFNTLMTGLYKTGFTGGLCRLVDKLAAGLGKDAMANCLLPLFGSWPSIWAMVTDDMYDEAYNHIFNEVCPEYDLDYSKLQAKVDNYTNTIRVNRTEILNRINEDCNLYVLSRRGFCTVFVVPDWDIRSDMAVDVACSSFGATVARYGQTLGEDYLAAADEKYISPDKSVDASTCLFPDQTWFLNNATHIPTFGCIHEYFATLLYYDGQADVNTFAQYPQYMIYDSKSIEFKAE
ncbi:MAG: hypothetical protein II702_10245 [Clostridia bacterium]|nr:hypothetical protein [Clostridia bacterium]